MKKIVIMLLFMAIVSVTAAQNPFDDELKKLSFELAEKIQRAGEKKIAIISLLDAGNNETPAGQILADIITTNLVDAGGNHFRITDRQNVERIIKIDGIKITDNELETAIRILSHLNAQLILIGNYMIVNNVVRVHLKAVNSKSVIVAAAMRTVPLDDNARAMLGVGHPGAQGRSDARKQLPAETSGNRSKQANCAEMNTGDYCFTNNRKARLEVQLFIRNPRTNQYDLTVMKWSGRLTLEPGETQCFYAVEATTAEYSVVETSNGAITRDSDNFRKEGNVYVDQCRSGSMVIR